MPLPTEHGGTAARRSRLTTAAIGSLQQQLEAKKHELEALQLEKLDALFEHAFLTALCDKVARLREAELAAAAAAAASGQPRRAAFDVASGDELLLLLQLRGEPSPSPSAAAALDALGGAPLAQPAGHEHLLPAGLRPSLPALQQQQQEDQHFIAPPGEPFPLWGDGRTLVVPAIIMERLTMAEWCARYRHLVQQLSLALMLHDAGMPQPLDDDDGDDADSTNTAALGDDGGGGGGGADGGGPSASDCSHGSVAGGGGSEATSGGNGSNGTATKRAAPASASSLPGCVLPDEPFRQLLVPRAAAASRVERLVHDILALLCVWWPINPSKLLEVIVTDVVTGRRIAEPSKQHHRAALEKMGLSDEQVRRIALGFRVLKRLQARVLEEQKRLQLDQAAASEAGLGVQPAAATPASSGSTATAAGRAGGAASGGGRSTSPSGSGGASGGGGRGGGSCSGSAAPAPAPEDSVQRAAQIEAAAERVQRIHRMMMKDMLLKAAMTSYLQGCLTWTQLARLHVLMFPFYPTPATFCLVVEEQFLARRAQQQQRAAAARDAAIAAAAAPSRRTRRSGATARPRGGAPPPSAAIIASRRPRLGAGGRRMDVDGGGGGGDGGSDGGDKDDGNEDDDEDEGDACGTK